MARRTIVQLVEARTRVEKRVLRLARVVGRSRSYFARSCANSDLHLAITDLHLVDRELRDAEKAARRAIRRM